jgi:hypothetical protein
MVSKRKTRPVSEAREQIAVFEWAAWKIRERKGARL